VLRIAFLALSVLGVATSAYAAEHQLSVAGATITVTIASTPAAIPEKALLAWVTRSASALVTYYGRFAVARARIEIDTVPGSDINGTTYPSGGGLITIRLGRELAQVQLDHDWVMTHEMVHLSFPSLARRHHWMEEGLATYVEPIARARRGDLEPERVWRDLVEGLPQGLPRSGDRGLDFTPTWGRTYWGGALYWLLADIEIRERTQNQKGLEHALRAIVAAGGTVAADWQIERVIEIGDQATGVPVLHELYEKMRKQPFPVDLPALWKRLGVAAGEHGAIVFDPHAPLAAVRAAVLADDLRALAPH
jgi:hypothetical protein